jgi:hypothetical protein
MDRFVVGTGRCGSTLLSRMLAEHHELLSIFEFFTGLDMTRRFTGGPMSGSEFATMVSQEHPFVTMVLRRGYDVEEITYPFGQHARYARDDALPWILVSTLPRLTDNPDELFDETVAFADTLPTQPPVDHYRALFDWWARRLHKTCWLERSGSSIEYISGLHELFPHARFLHLHRDGPETALSMREHHAYRLAVTLLFQIEGQGVPSIAELRGLDPQAKPTPDDPISQILRSEPPVEYFGRYWSQELEHGYRAVHRLGTDQYLEVSFEELVARPHQTLRTIASFFDLDSDGAWIERASRMVRGQPPTRFETLSPVEQERLTEACAPGMQLLRRAP